MTYEEDIKLTSVVNRNLEVLKSCKDLQELNGLSKNDFFLVEEDDSEIVDDLSSIVFKLTSFSKTLEEVKKGGSKFIVVLSESNKIVPKIVEWATK